MQNEVKLKLLFSKCTKPGNKKRENIVKNILSNFLRYKDKSVRFPLSINYTNSQKLKMHLFNFILQSKSTFKHKLQISA